MKINIAPFPLILRFLFLGMISTIPQAVYSQCEVLLWSDEFNGTGLPNSTDWGFDLGASGWGNNEVQNYTNSTTNVRQENGNLVIEAIKSGNNWTSARVKSQNKRTFTYGKIVFRAKLPTGVGTWPAFWLLGNNISSVGWPACGEIDVMEHVGKNQDVIQAALHTPSSFGNTQNKKSVVISNVSTEFHEYAVSWNKDRMIFMVDDVPYYTYQPAVKNASTWPFDAEHFLIMNIAMGGSFGGPTIDPALTSARMEIDYVRVYEERTSPLVEGPAFVFQNQQNVSYTAPNYGTGVSYQWAVPAGATIVSGQGTRQITVNWGSTDGQVSLELTGNTGCSVNTATIAVSTITEPTGNKYVITEFSTGQLPGWSANDNGISYSATAGKLNVNYNVGALKYLEYKLSRAVDLEDFGILKFPLSVPTTSAIPSLLVTLLDGEGNETITSKFEVKVNQADGVSYLYSYNFDGRWNQNTPPVNANFIQSIRIYMLPGQGSFQLGALEMFNSKVIPSTPTNLAASITPDSEIAIRWDDVANATAYNLYRASGATESYTRIKSNIRTNEVPFIVSATTAVSYYKISSVNTMGESPLSEEIEVVSTITSSEHADNFPISIYPNPSSGRFLIKTNGRPISNLTIYDAKGKIQAFDQSSDDSSLLMIELKTVSTGLYFISLQQEKRTLVVKVHVQ
jgi:beta-glucanase (GH16 family)